MWIHTEGRHQMGITFLCPSHGIDGLPGYTCYLGVWFENPLDGGAPYQDGAPFPDRDGPHIQVVISPLWKRRGDSFDTLTLTPSIDVKGHWHGHITDGEIA
jgi:hypothetical protein